MADQMHVVLKTGQKPQPGEEDKRTAYDGRVKRGVGTTFRDDHWTRTPHGEKREKLVFALHVQEGYLADIVQEYCEFRAAFASGEAKQTLEAFLNELRSRFMESMPDIPEGVLFYLFEREKRAYKGISGPVTHRQRYA